MGAASGTYGASWRPPLRQSNQKLPPDGSILKCSRTPVLRDRGRLNTCFVKYQFSLGRGWYDAPPTVPICSSCLYAFFVRVFNLNSQMSLRDCYYNSHHVIINTVRFITDLYSCLFTRRTWFLVPSVLFEQ